MKLNMREILKPTLVLFLICLFSVSALAGTNALTSDKIVEANLATAEQSRKIVLPEADSFSERDGCYKGIKGGAEVGYVFETESKGYGGTVKVMTGIDTNGNVTGVVILSHNETPGLGANAAKEDFRKQFQQQVQSGGFSVVKNRAATDGEVEALTGATITTQAVTDAVNLAIGQYEAMKGVA